jgi:hypothetical protein
MSTLSPQRSRCQVSMATPLRTAPLCDTTEIPPMARQQQMFARMRRSSNGCSDDGRWLRKPLLYPLSYEGGTRSRLPVWAYLSVPGRPSRYTDGRRRRACACHQPPTPPGSHRPRSNSAPCRGVRIRTGLFLRICSHQELTQGDRHVIAPDGPHSTWTLSPPHPRCEPRQDFRGRRRSVPSPYAALKA